MDAAPELVLDVVEVLAAVPRSSLSAEGDVRLASLPRTGGPRRAVRPQAAVLVRWRRRECRADAGRPRGDPEIAEGRVVHSGEDRIRTGTQSGRRRRGEDRDPHDVPPPGR